VTVTSAPCPHGFTIGYCPTCLLNVLGQEAEVRFDLSVRYAKALEVVEAARALDKQQDICEDVSSDTMTEDEGDAAFEVLYRKWATLRAVLAAFDEVQA
jgi:hypothetical protein